MAKRQTITSKEQGAGSREQGGQSKSALRDLPVGMDLLDRPLLNKSTAFTEEERKKFGLHGLLPPQVESLPEQVVRTYEAYQRKKDDLERHIYLRALQDTNEVLFYRLLLEHIEEMTPMVYTTVVALGCQQFSHIYRRPRGLFISYPLRDSIPQLLRNRPNPDVDVIVVTDGERILGIGDQGAGGLGIPIGKLSLYTLIGGIRPERTLPIVLDVGTNNAERLKDAEYLGWRHERVTGQAYFDFVDQFVQAVKQELPNTCLQWEDFATPHARPILERYRDELLTFNDDIQGTAAVALGATLGAVKVAGPIIFPLSNPTSKSEAKADDLIRWTDGRALVATGSPFAPVPYGGSAIPIAQCNNIYIFPAMGLGVVASGARRVTDTMILAAARALGERSPALTDPSASLLPALPQLREVAAHVATAVGLEAQRAGVATKTSEAELRERVAATQWTPAYPAFATSKAAGR